MNKLLIIKKLIFVFCFITCIVFPVNQVFSDETKNLEIAEQQDSVKIVFQYEIKDMIAAPVWRLTQKAFEEAEKIKADLIIIHMNTYGGTLDAADSIRTKILNSTIPVWVFIDNNAASAGALIAISCDSIYMRPGGSIGAATVVNQTGEPMPDKYQSFMRSMMRSTAETKGRDPHIAEAMVDPSIYIENVIDTGKVLTFTATEAIENGFCEGTADNVQEILEQNQIVNYEIKKQEISAMDRFIGFLISPAISGILIILIIGGIYFELQSPGIGFPLVVALIAAMLYFAPLYLEGLAENWEIILFILGVGLIGVEIFVIPGFGIAGVSGIALVITGLVLSMIGNVGFDFSGVESNLAMRALFIAIIALFLSLLGSFYLTKRLFTTKTFGEFALHDVQKKEEGYTSAVDEYKQMVGKQGVAATVLRPSGKIEIDDELYDATAISGFINKGENIEVIKYETTQLFVRRIS